MKGTAGHICERSFAGAPVLRDPGQARADMTISITPRNEYEVTSRVTADQNVPSYTAISSRRHYIMCLVIAESTAPRTLKAGFQLAKYVKFGVFKDFSSDKLRYGSLKCLAFFPHLAFKFQTWQ